MGGAAAACSGSTVRATSAGLGAGAAASAWARLAAAPHRTRSGAWRGARSCTSRVGRPPVAPRSRSRCGIPIATSGATSAELLLLSLCARRTTMVSLCFVVHEEENREKVSVHLRVAVRAADCTRGRSWPFGQSSATVLVCGGLRAAGRARREGSELPTVYDSHLCVYTVGTGARAAGHCRCAVGEHTVYQCQHSIPTNSTLRRSK